MNSPVPRYSGHTIPLASHLARAGWRALDRRVSSTEVTHRQMLVLTLLEDRGPMAQKAFREFLGLDASNVVGLLNELEEQGLVVRRRNPDDRRQHVVERTDAGVRALEHTYARLAIVEKELLGTLTPAEQAQLQALLSRVVSAPAASGTNSD